MDHLLIIPLNQSVPETLLRSLNQGGWRVSVTTDMVRVKQLLQTGEIAGVVMEFNSVVHDPERLKVLRFVQDFCPRTTVTMLQSFTDKTAEQAATQMIGAFNAVDDARGREKALPSADFYHLSPAQRRIAELVAQAYPNREIARKLKIKEQSVRNELSRIFRKIGVWNRVELALLIRDGRAKGVEAEAEVKTGVEQPWMPGFVPPAESQAPTTVPTV